MKICLLYFFCYRAQSSNLSQYIAYIHDMYLKRICEESRFQGLKYHGGPISRCLCKEEKVLQFVSFIMKKADDQIVSDEVNVPKIDMKCEECLMEQNVNELLQSQVSFLPWILSCKDHSHWVSSWLMLAGEGCWWCWLSGLTNPICKCSRKSAMLECW